MLVVRGGDGGLACAEFRHVRLDGERQHDQDRQCNCGKCERGNGKQAARTAGTIVLHGIRWIVDSMPTSLGRKRFTHASPTPENCFVCCSPARQPDEGTSPAASAPTMRRTSPGRKGFSMVGRPLFATN